MNNRTKTLRADPKSLGFMFFLCWQICLVPRHHTSLVSCVSCLVASFWGASELSSLALFHQGTFGWNYLWWYCWSLFGLLRAQALSEIPSWAQWRPDVFAFSAHSQRTSRSTRIFVPAAWPSSPILLATEEQTNGLSNMCMWTQCQLSAWPLSKCIKPG